MVWPALSLSLLISRPSRPCFTTEPANRQVEHWDLLGEPGPSGMKCYLISPTVVPLWASPQMLISDGFPLNPTVPHQGSSGCGGFSLPSDFMSHLLVKAPHPPVQNSRLFTYLELAELHDARKGKHTMNLPVQNDEQEASQGANASLNNVSCLWHCYISIYK